MAGISTKITIIFSLVFLIIFLANCSKNSDNNVDFAEILIDNGNKLIKINAEIADDNEKRMQGLMFRESLSENDGMFFIFEDESALTFWMKDTLIPLDIIFIGDNFEIVEIKNAMPCKADPCETYQSSSLAKYVLEVNSGFAEKNKIGIGDKVIVK